MIFIPRELAARADAVIPQPDYRFSSDGCSGGMSWLWRTVAGVAPPWEGACVEHDFAYWQGGTRGERRAADRALREHVLAKAGDYALIGAALMRTCAWAMWAAVRLGGGPLWPTDYRWGYGWKWPHGYQREN
jgi:hypothetical protein